MDYPRRTPQATKREKKDNSQGSVKRSKVTIEALVDDCFLRIFSYLELRDLGKVEQVSTRFQELARRSFRVYRNIHSDRDKIRTLSHARTISAKVGTGLRRLKAYGGSEQSFTLEMLEAFLVNCPNIEHLKFTGIPVQELGMLRLLDAYVAQIKNISFVNCDLDDSEDAMFFRHLEQGTNLEDVSVKSEHGFTGKWLKYLKNLKRIDLQECPRIQPSHFIEFCKRNTTLNYLKITTFPMNHECIKTIVEELKNLQSICIKCSDFPTSGNLSILGDLPKLEELEIVDFNHLTVPLLKRLAFHNKLQVLKFYFDGASFRQESAKIFREIVTIQGLKLFHLNCYECFAFGDEHLKISTMDQLEELEIPATGVTDQGLFDFILRNPSLRTLDISYCWNITDEFAEMIIPRLQTDFKSLSIRAGGSGISAENYKILLNDKD